MVLGKLVDLLLSAVLCKALDLVAIPAHLPTDDIPPSQLCFDCFYLGVFMLDSDRFNFQLLSSQLFLASYSLSKHERNVS